MVQQRVQRGRAAGVVAYRIADGELVTLRAKAVMLATGGFGRMFRVTSNAYSLTGDDAAGKYAVSTLWSHSPTFSFPGSGPFSRSYSSILY